MQSFTLLAVLASTTTALVPRGQDSSNFLLDTAPQGYTAVLTQISDGQVQVPTAAPSVPAVPEVPSISIPPAESSLIYTLPVDTTWEASLPIETFSSIATVPEVPPVETPSVILPPTTAVVVPPVLITETGSLVLPNATSTLRTTAAPTTVGAPGSSATPPTNEAGMSTVSTFGLVAAAAVALLL